MSGSFVSPKRRIDVVTLRGNKASDFDPDRAQIAPGGVIGVVDEFLIEAWRISSSRLTVRLFLVDGRGKAREGKADLPLYGPSFVRGWKFTRGELKNLTDWLRFNVSMTLLLTANGMPVNGCEFEDDQTLEAVRSVIGRMKRPLRNVAESHVQELIRRMRKAEERHLEKGASVAVEARKSDFKFEFAEDLLIIGSSGGQAALTSLIVGASVGYAPWDFGKFLGRLERMNARTIVVAANLKDDEFGFFVGDFWTSAIDAPRLSATFHPLKAFADEAESWVNSAAELDDAPFAFGEMLGLIGKTNPAQRERIRMNGEVRKGLRRLAFAMGVEAAESDWYEATCFEIMKRSAVILWPLRAIGDARQLLVEASNAMGDG